MTNAKPVTDNEEKAKSKMKKDALEVQLAALSELQVGDDTHSGKDLSDLADALAGAKVAQKAINGMIEEAEVAIKSAMLRQYCDHFAAKGHPPDIRHCVGAMGSFKAVQHKTAKITASKAESLKDQGIDLLAHKEAVSYSIRWAALTERDTNLLIAFLKDKVLKERYGSVVTENIHVGEKFFGKLDKIVKETLGENENLDEKMLAVMRVISPTIVLSGYESDLDEAEGYDLARSFSRVMGDRRKAIKDAAKQARRAQAEKLKAAKAMAREIEKAAKGKAKKSA